MQNCSFGSFATLAKIAKTISKYCHFARLQQREDCIGLCFDLTLTITAVTSDSDLQILRYPEKCENPGYFDQFDSAIEIQTSPKNSGIVQKVKIEVINDSTTENLTRVRTT